MVAPMRESLQFQRLRLIADRVQTIHARLDKPYQSAVPVYLFPNFQHDEVTRFIGTDLPAGLLNKVFRHYE